MRAMDADSAPNPESDHHTSCWPSRACGTKDRLQTPFSPRADPRTPPAARSPLPSPPSTIHPHMCNRLGLLQTQMRPKGQCARNPSLEPSAHTTHAHTYICTPHSPRAWLKVPVEPAGIQPAWLATACPFARPLTHLQARRSGFLGP